MSRFNSGVTTKNTATSAVKAKKSGKTVTNHYGAEAYERTAKSELFLAAVSDFATDSFYENEGDRRNRIAKLAAKVAVKDSEWITNFVAWLRDEAQMRSVSVEVAVEAAVAMIKADVPGGRKVIDNAIQRADEPGEILGYFHAYHGRKIPSAIKRGVSDAIGRVYNEYSIGKYNGDSRSFSFGDVIQLVHPKPVGNQSALFRYALSRDSKPSTEGLPMLTKRAEFLALSAADKRKLVESGESSKVLKEAGLTWEILGSTISGGWDSKAWEAIIPSMGYMALLRNLRNFAQNGVSDKVMDDVLNRLSDPEQVAKSRQLPFRFLSAYNANKENLRFAYPLEKALNASLSNVPSLKGRTLILVDRSGSMFRYWGGSQVKATGLDYADTAAIFGTTVALKAEDATLVQFGSSSREVKFNKTDSVLTTLKKFDSLGGTDTAGAIRSFIGKGYDRVILLTDEQTYANPYSAIPSDIPVYVWNFAGYRGSSSKASNVFGMGGMTDKSFSIIQALEAGRDGNWTWNN